MSQHLIDELKLGIESMRLDIPTHTPEKLIDYIGLLNHWNRSFNLTAVRDPEEMISKHLLDSLSVLPFIGDGSVVDVGSGAGLPGIPLALSRPQQKFVLIDTNGKKTRFLQQAKIVLGLENMEVIHRRVEQYAPTHDGRARYFDVVIARAYASTDDILKTTRHLHDDATRILVMQGKLDERIDTPGYVLKQAHELTVPGLDAERHLLEISRT